MIAGGNVAVAEGAGHGGRRGVSSSHSSAIAKRIRCGGIRQRGIAAHGRGMLIFGVYAIGIGIADAGRSSALVAAAVLEYSIPHYSGDSVLP